MSGYAVQTLSYRIGAVDYRLRSLADRQQFSDPDGAAAQAGISSASWPLFGMVWPAGLALAEQMATFPIEGKRILEVGCGLALSSLVLQRRGADVTASDHHPLAGEFLRHNSELNGLPPVSFFQAAWELPNADLGAFDLIIGSDLLYERDHPALLASFIALHATKDARVVIADPGREQSGRFGKAMAAHGYAATDKRPAFAGTKQGWIATFARAVD